MNLNHDLHVDFALMESYGCLLAAIIADCRNGLFTSYNFVKGHMKKNISTYGDVPVGVFFDIISRQFSHLIMDSGVYSLVYGKDKHVKKDRKEISSWYDAYTDFINKYVPSTVNIVEVDCQSATGTDDAWLFRKRIRSDCPYHKVINVWHVEDGQYGLDKLIEYSDYLAIPPRQLLRYKFSHEKIKQLVRYIKSKKHSIKIHLLGYTHMETLKQIKNLVYSVDSSTWKMFSRFGTLPSIGLNQKDAMSLSKGINGYDTKLLESEYRRRLVSVLGDKIDAIKHNKAEVIRNAMSLAICKKKYNEMLQL